MSFYAGLAILLAVTSAEADHTSEALKHTDEAVKSAGDAKAVSEHATEALKQIEAAKATERSDPEVLKKLVKSEAVLKDALTNANRYNSTTALEKASEAKTHLDAAVKK
jgi:hypothetical protein